MVIVLEIKQSGGEKEAELVTREEKEECEKAKKEGKERSEGRFLKKRM